MKKPLTKKEIAKILGISRQSLYEKIRSGFTTDDVMKLKPYLDRIDFRIMISKPRGRPRKEAV